MIETGIGKFVFAGKMSWGKLVTYAIKLEGTDGDMLATEEICDWINKIVSKGDTVKIVKKYHPGISWEVYRIKEELVGENVSK